MTDSTGIPMGDRRDRLRSSPERRSRRALGPRSLGRPAPSRGRIADHQRARRVSAKRLPLFLPARRQRPFQLFQHERLVRAPFKKHLDNVWRQQSQPQDPADVALRDVLSVANVADGGVDALVEHSLPAPRPRERLQKCAVGLRFRVRGKFAPVRRHDALTTAAALEPHRIDTTSVLPSSRLSMLLIMPPSSRPAAARRRGSPNRRP